MPSGQRTSTSAKSLSVRRGAHHCAEQLSDPSMSNEDKERLYAQNKRRYQMMSPMAATATTASDERRCTKWRDAYCNFSLVHVPRVTDDVEVQQFLNQCSWSSGRAMRDRH